MPFPKVLTPDSFQLISTFRCGGPTFTLWYILHETIGTLGESTSMATREDIVEDGRRRPVLNIKEKPPIFRA